MIELPEAVTLARQMNATLAGKTLASFALGPLTHKFLSLNRPDEEYQAILAGRTVTGARSCGRSIHLLVDKDCMLWWGDAGGRILYHEAGAEPPGKYHLRWDFTDGSHLTYALQMWGFVKLLDRTAFGERPDEDTGIAPLTPEFTLASLEVMMEEYPERKSKGVKGFLVATGYVAPKHINGLGNAYVQDILFRAGIDPRRKVPAIPADERRKLYDAIQSVLQEAVDLDGRDEERDLFDQPGRYVRRMSSRTAGGPCPTCGSPIQKIQYLGGGCYLCTRCQV